MAGAEFEIYAADAKGKATGAALAKATSDADGIVRFPGLYLTAVPQAQQVDPGTIFRDFFVVETEAPDGYRLNSGQTKVTVANGILISDSAALATALNNANLVIKNDRTPPPHLPKTGGSQGLLAGGALLLLGGGLARLVMRRRREDAAE